MDPPQLSGSGVSQAIEVSETQKPLVILKHDQGEVRLTPAHVCDKLILLPLPALGDPTPDMDAG
eukprot:244751-Hanusia_phi.AAC.2